MKKKKLNAKIRWLQLDIGKIMKLMNFLWNTPPFHVPSLLPSFQYLLLEKWPESDEALTPHIFKDMQSVYIIDIMDIIMLVTVLPSAKQPPFW